MVRKSTALWGLRSIHCGDARRTRPQCDVKEQQRSLAGGQNARTTWPESDTLLRFCPGCFCSPENIDSFDEAIRTAYILHIPVGWEFPPTTLGV